MAEEAGNPPEKASKTPDIIAGLPWGEILKLFDGGGGNSGGGKSGSEPFNPNANWPDLLPHPAFPDVNPNRESLPGWTDIGPYDFDALLDQFMGLGKGGGGGGGGGGKGGVSGIDEFLSGLFGGGIEDIGQFDPALMGNIQDLMGASGSEFQDFNQFIKGQGNNLLDFIMQGMGGGDIGGGGGGFRGGGFSAPPSGPTNLSELFGQTPEFTPRDINVGLQNLPPEIAAELDRIKAAEQSELENLRGEVSGDLLTRLFGSGIERSTVAGEATARASQGLERSLLQAQAADASRRLGIQTGEAERRLSADLGLLGSETDVYKTRLGSSTDIARANIAANAQTTSASIGASASAAAAASSADTSMKIARLNTLANIFDTQTRGLTTGFGSRQGAITDLAGIFGDLAKTGAGLDVEKNLGLAGLGFQDIDSRRRAGVASAANRSSASAQQQRAFLDFLGFQEDVAGRLQSGQLQREGFDLQRWLANVEAQLGRYSAKKGSSRDSSGWERILGTAAQAAAAYYGSKNG